MTELRKRMLEDMQLAGFSQRTQKSYLGAVRNLASYFHRSPDQLDESELRQFFLHLIDERKLAPSSVTVYLCAIKFLFEKTLQRDWKVFALVRPQRCKKLPTVLSRQEVAAILGLLRKIQYKAALSLIYSCGLRLLEATHLRVEDLDSQRMVVRIHQAKGNKDRHVPLPQPTLTLLRQYWPSRYPQTYNASCPWLFPSSRTPERPIHESNIQKAFRAALRESGIPKSASVHTLRHSYATHLLESGVNLRVIQQLLGHKSPQTTAIYMHVTEVVQNQLQDTLNHLLSHLEVSEPEL